MPAGQLGIGFLKPNVSLKRGLLFLALSSPPSCLRYCKVNEFELLAD